MHGLTLRRVVVEEGVSGSIQVHERPAGRPLFVKLKKGDLVIAPKLDRLFRSALDDVRPWYGARIAAGELYFLA